MTNPSEASFDLSLSQQLHDAVGAQAKACWWNAYWALQELGEGWYVEGFVGIHLGIVVEHAWVETVDGRIADPSPTFCGRLYRYKPALGYYAGVRYTIGELEELATQYPHESADDLPDLPLVWRTGGFGGFLNPEYRAANNAAYQKVFGRTLDEIRAQLDHLNGGP